MSKKLGVLLAVVLLAAMAAPVLAQGAFADVPPDHWAYQAVDKLSKAGLVEGYPDGQFKGNRAMTRYEFAMVIARLLNTLPATGALGPQGPAGPVGPVGPAGGLTPEQQALLGRLQNEFAPELAKLREDVNNLTSRVSDLEAALARKPKLTIDGSISVRTGLYGTKLQTGASESTGYPYPGIGGPYNQFDCWFVPALWGGINIPIPDTGMDGGEGAAYGSGWLFGPEDTNAFQQTPISIPISDALKDAFKAPNFMTMRTKVRFNANLSPAVSAGVTLLADPRGNLVTPYSEVDDASAGDDGILSNRTPNIYYSDGIMDTVKVDEAYMKYGGDFIRPFSVTAGKLYWGFGRGLLANNSQFPTKSVRLDVGLTGVPGDGITYSAVLAALDREAFGGYMANLPQLPDPFSASGRTHGQDFYMIQNVAIPIGRTITVGGTYLGTGFQSERGWSVDATARLFGIDLWGEFAKLTNFPDGSRVTFADVKNTKDQDNQAWVVGAGWRRGDFNLGAQYGVIEPLYAFTDVGRGWDPTGLGAVLSGGGTPGLETDPLVSLGNGYLNLPLSLMHPLEEFNPHFINWLDRPLFLDPTNVAKGWEVSGGFSRLLGEKTPISFRYYTGKAYKEEYLGWLFNDGGAVNSKPSKWRDADPVWSVTIGHHFSDTLTANLTYGQRNVDNVMSSNPNPEVNVQDDKIKLLRLDMNIAF